MLWLLLGPFHAMENQVLVIRIKIPNSGAVDWTVHSGPQLLFRDVLVSANFSVSVLKSGARHLWGSQHCDHWILPWWPELVTIAGLHVGAVLLLPQVLINCMDWNLTSVEVCGEVEMNQIGPLPSRNSAWTGIKFFTQKQPTEIHKAESRREFCGMSLAGFQVFLLSSLNLVTSGKEKEDKPNQSRFSKLKVS